MKLAGEFLEPISMKLCILVIVCVSLLSAQVPPTKADLDEKMRKLQNETAQSSALADDLVKGLITKLTQALEAAKASGNLAQAGELTKALEAAKALGKSSNGPPEPAKALANSTATNPTPPSAAVWGYMLLRFTISDRSLDEIEQLNSAGQRGYELVSVVQAGNERLFYLKRRVQ